VQQKKLATAIGKTKVHENGQQPQQQPAEAADVVSFWHR
jgi:hypothetical protein